MLRFQMLEASAAFTDYTARLAARPALQRAEARNAAIAAEHGLHRG
jgi:glutathione S-transferase